MKNKNWVKAINEDNRVYLIEGNEDIILKDLESFLEFEWDIPRKANPDVLFLKTSVLKIEDSREISRDAYSLPVYRDKKIFTIVFGIMTKEAANALLKILEEPPEYSFFFLITQNPEKLPETLLSRTIRVKVREESLGPQDISKEAIAFLNWPLAKKFEYSKKLGKEVSDGEESRSSVLKFFDEVEKGVFQKIGRLKAGKGVLSEIEECRSYLKDSSSSVKMIIDQLALLLLEMDNLLGKKG